MRKLTWTLMAGAGLVFTGMGTASPAMGQQPAGTNPAVITVKPLRAAMLPGGLVTVEVYLTNAAGVGGYQLKLDVTGGDSGSLTLENFMVQKNHKGVLFGAAKTIEALAPAVGEFLVVRYQGGTDVAANEQRYLGTATFRVSPDASGAFQINVTTNEQSILMHASGANLAFRPGKPAVMVVGGTGAVRPDVKNRTPR